MVGGPAKRGRLVLGLWPGSRSGDAGGFLFRNQPAAANPGPLPATPSDLVLFFVVGGFIAPVAEELCFRGIIYTFFRRWGIVFALTISTVLFVLLHSVQAIPVTQVLGGIVFALAYETSKNLMTPSRFMWREISPYSACLCRGCSIEVPHTLGILAEGKNPTGRAIIVSVHPDLRQPTHTRGSRSD
jgi:hypothetical protein